MGLALVLSSGCGTEDVSRRRESVVSYRFDCRGVPLASAMTEVDSVYGRFGMPLGGERTYVKPVGFNLRGQRDGAEYLVQAVDARVIVSVFVPQPREVATREERAIAAALAAPFRQCAAFSLTLG
jgi:hypothetical protein